jgi:hypothetical protein
MMENTKNVPNHQPDIFGDLCSAVFHIGALVRLCQMDKIHGVPRFPLQFLYLLLFIGGHCHFKIQVQAQRRSIFIKHAYWKIMEIHRFSGFPSSKFDDADLQPISPQCPLMGGSVHTEEGQVTAAMRRMPRDLKVATCRGTGRPQLCSGKPYRNETMSEKGCEDMCRTLSLSPCSYNVLSMYYMDAYIYIHTIINISLYIINYNHRANGLQE